ncbi:phosphatases II, partial [Calocera cornea HHB12733]
PTSSSAPQPFVISEILPGFLYLGPEPSTDDEVQQLVDRGVKRILNMAEECEDDQGLGLRRKFEMYERVPMRDTVNEENIGRGVRAACLFLDDARLHDSPTYVHCKAGKSRSVTVVMGYLIHAHSWPLSKAYAYVMEKRQGISPNIGFVSELMKFEESQLGTKSVGVGEEGHGHHHAARNAKPAGLGLRRLARGGGARESLPPLSRGASARERTPVSSSLGDAATEKEVKDSDGRYVHARKVPVDRRTLQPQRRVSKAGLESA